MTLRIHHGGGRIARAADRGRRARAGDRRSAAGTPGRPRASPGDRPESLQLAVAAEDPLAHRSRVRLIDLADRAFVEYRADSSLRASIDRACQAVGLERRIVCEVDTVVDLVELVALGVGVSLLPPAAIPIDHGHAIGVATIPRSRAS